jgi:alkylated DNA repair dioxygenase AlkB
MTTQVGYVMSVAMTNCDAAGWITDWIGYRYDLLDPESGLPASSVCFHQLSSNLPGRSD